MAPPLRRVAGRHYHRPMPRPPAPQDPSPRWQRLDADERRRQILDCARRAFVERPYAAVSMAEIAACAGVRRGLLHHYFGGKHELYVAVVRDLLARFAAVVEAPAPAPGAGGGTLDDLVATYVDRWLGLVEQQADAWFALIDAESGTSDAEVLSLVARARAATIDGVIGALGLTDVSPELRVVLRAYSSVAEVATRQWLRHGNLDRARAHALLSTTMVVMLREVVPAVERAGDDADPDPERSGAGDAAGEVSPPGARRPASRARAARA